MPDILRFVHHVWDLNDWVKAIGLFLYALITLYLGAYFFFGNYFVKLRPASASAPVSAGQPISPATLQIAAAPVVNANGDAKAIQAPAQVVSNSSGAVIQNAIYAKEVYVGGEPVSLQLDDEREETFGSEMVQVQTYKAEHKSGSVTGIKVFIIYNSAAWKLNSSSQFIKGNNSDITDISSFLESDVFALDSKTYQAIVCLGTASGYRKDGPARSIALSDERAVYLCGRISRRIQFTSENTQVFGLPLGYNLKESVSPNTVPERKQRAIVIVAAHGKSTDFLNTEGHKALIEKILQGNALKDFDTSEYSEVAAGAPLRYLRVERGVYINDKSPISIGRARGRSLLDRR